MFLNEKTMTEKEQDFKDSIFRHIEYPKDLLQEFYEYWTEPNKSKTKMKWEMERTWDLERRLRRWSNNNFKKPMEIKTDQNVQTKQAPKSEDDNVNYLNDVLNDYRLHYDKILNERYVSVYDYLKEKRLIKMTPDEIQEVRATANGDVQKGKAIAIKMIFSKMIAKNECFR